MQFNSIVGLFFTIFVADCLGNLIPSKPLELVVKPVNTNLLNIQSNIQGRYNDGDCESDKCDSPPYIWYNLPCNYDGCSDPNQTECSNSEYKNCQRTVSGGAEWYSITFQIDTLHTLAPNLDFEVDFLSDRDCNIKVIQKDCAVASVIAPKNGYRTIIIVVGFRANAIIQDPFTIDLKYVLTC